MLVRNLLIPAVAIIIGYCLSSIPSYAQDISPELQALRVQYDQIEFEKVRALGDSLLHTSQQWSPDEYVFLHHYLGLAHFNLGEEDSARAHFLSLLSIRRDFELDPVETSPKIIDFFHEVKKEADLLLRRPGNAGFTHYVLVEDDRTAALWRSAFIPGWGQFYKGQKTRGILIGTAFWGGVAATLLAYQKEDDARHKYLQASDPATISAHYDTYNRWFKNRRVLGYATAAIWLLGVLDAGLSSKAQPQVALNAGGTPLYGLSISW